MKHLQEKSANDFYISCEEKEFIINGNYINNKTKINLECKHGHRFTSRPSDIKNGSNCPGCVGRSPHYAKTAFFQLCKEKGYQVVEEYTTSNTKLKIMCQHHHLFESRPSSIKTGSGCPTCVGLSTESSKTHFLEVCQSKDFIPQEEYVSNNTPIQLQCSAGHLFTSKPLAIKKGAVCKYCAKKSPEAAKDYFIKMCEKNKIDLLGTYTDTLTKVKISCKNGHYYEALPIKQFFTCQQCKHITNKQTLTELCSKKGFTLLSDYTTNTTKINLRCINNHQFRLSPEKIKRGIGCSACMKNCPIEAKKVFMALIQTKNLLILGDYVNSSTKITLQCEKGHRWQTKPNSVKYYGCPVCSTSHLEQRIERILTLLGVPYIHQWRDHQCKNKLVLPYDFYIPDFNLVIEANGAQHYQHIPFFNRTIEEFMKRKKLDKKKKQYCLNEGIQFLEIPYTEINQIEQIVTQTLHTIIETNSLINE
jgi:very-short-patch-repair endonuclease